MKLIDDIARAHILAMEKGSAGERYIIAGPPHTLIEALAIAERITGIKAPRMHPGPNVMRSFATLLDWLGTIMPLPAAFSGEAMRTSAAVTYIGDNAKAKRELGFDPRPLGAGLSETLRFEMARNIARASRAPAS